MKRLKDIVGKRQLFEAYPTSRLNYEHNKSIRVTISDAMAAFQAIVDEIEKHPPIAEIVNPEDFRDITMMLSEWTYKLNNK
jgi:hypothetical protein